MPMPADNEGRVRSVDELDEMPPQIVAETIRFCQERGLWFVLGRNPPVRSCREAASRRLRLGKRGIPLRDELRSYLAQGFDSGGRKRTILFHCRGDQTLSLERLAKLDLGVSDLTKARIADLNDEHMAYGLVNPFLSAARQATLGLVRQVFDQALLKNTGEAGTMMTNAGNLTWSIEFQPAALIEALSPEGAVVAPIAAENQQSPKPFADRTIGILTGNGPESGALLWKKINDAVRLRMGAAFAGDISYPRVLVSSLPPMGWSMELEKRSNLLWDKIDAEVSRLADSGADVIALACNTTQFYQERIDALLNPRKVRFIRLSSTIERWIKTRGHPIYTVGIREVVSNSTCSAFTFLHECGNIVFPDRYRLEQIESIAYRIKQHGVDHIALQRFRRIMRQAPCDEVLLLLTEFSLVNDKYQGRSEVGRVITDSMTLYAQDIADELQSH